MPKAVSLSIIVPVYNEEGYLSACLDSIAKQTVMPDEVIVVDNNSTDRSAEVAKSYPFVRVVKAREQGIVHARNAGFDAAKSDVIGRLDADSVLPPGWVSYVKNFYQSPDHQDHALTGGGYFYNVSFPGRRINGWIQSQIAFRVNRWLLGHYILWGSNMALPAKLWRQVKPDVCLRNDVHEDLDLAIHLHRRGFPITYRAKLKVGVAVRRVFVNKKALYRNLMMWPQTLRTHGRWTWIFGWMGAVLLWLGSFLITPSAKHKHTNK